jgi:hypothetical protein
MGLFGILFGSGKKSSGSRENDRPYRRDDTDHHEREGHQRWLDERSKDP